mgnify:CR=1 FL=1
MTDHPPDTPKSLRALAEELCALSATPDLRLTQVAAALDVAEDALRRAADRLEAADDSETIATQAYQVIGALVFDRPETPEIVRALDYFSEGKFDEGFLPWRRDWLDETAGTKQIASTVSGPEATPSERSCTCHPDDDPPVPCPRKYALLDCLIAAARRAGAEEMRASIVRWLRARAAPNDGGPIDQAAVKIFMSIAGGVATLPLPGDQP